MRSLAWTSESGTWRSSQPDDPVENPRALQRAQGRLRLYQRKLDRQRRANNPGCYRPDGTAIKGRRPSRASTRQRATERNLARAHARARNVRQDAIHKLTTKLAATSAADESHRTSGDIHVPEPGQMQRTPPRSRSQSGLREARSSPIATGCHANAHHASKGSGQSNLRSLRKGCRLSRGVAGVEFAVDDRGLLTAARSIDVDAQEPALDPRPVVVDVGRYPEAHARGCDGTSLNAGAASQ